MITTAKARSGYGRAVYFQWNNEERRLPYICQDRRRRACPARPDSGQLDEQPSKGVLGRVHGAAAADQYAADDPNFDQPTAHDLHKLLHRYFELAGFFTMVAGLLNVLAIYDAWAGPVVVHAACREGRDKKEEEAA